METNGSEFLEAYKLGAARAVAETAGAVQVVMVPDGMHVVSLECYGEKPARKRGKAVFEDVGSFVAYVNKHKGDGTELFWSRPREGGMRVEAIFNHHTSAGAGWSDHRAELVPVLSREWLRWMAENRKVMNQEDFARFLEDGVLEIVQPKGAEVVEIASRLEAVKTVKFSRGVRMEDGNQEIHYEEGTEARAGQKGAFKVPPVLKLGIRVFEDGDAYSLEARLRYRIREDKLAMWYELVNHHAVFKDAVKSMGQKVAQGVGLTPLGGTWAGSASA